MSAQRVLVLYCSEPTGQMRATVAQHLRVLDRAPRPVEVVYCDARRGSPGWLRFLRFDGAILHNTFLGMRWSSTFPRWKRSVEWVSDVAPTLIALPQDEYDRSETLDQWLFELGVTDVFSVLADEHRDVLYPTMRDRARFHRALTGYIDDESAEQVRTRLVPLESRPFDVVYRATRLPYWFGSHGQLKHLVGEAVLAAAPNLGLTVDVSTRPDDVIFGEAWFDFLISGRAVVGCDSGSSALDRRGELRARIDALLADDPALSFEAATRALPAGWDEHAFFALSPRHLEAVVTKTAQVLVEGDYSGVLTPGRHYFSVRADLSDLADALEQLRDVPLLERVVEQAYEDVYRSGDYSYRRFAAELTDVLAGTGRPRRRVPVAVLGLAERAAAVHARVPVAAPRQLHRFLQAPRATVAKTAASLRLAAGRASLRAIALAYIRSSELRREVPSQLVVADLVRLAVLQRTAGVEQPSFRLQWTLDDRRRSLRLQSTPVAERATRNAIGREWLAAILADGVEEIVWDHSRVGSDIELPGAGGRRLALGDTYSFSALTAVGRRRPDEVATAMAEVLAQ